MNLWIVKQPLSWKPVGSRHLISIPRSGDFSSLLGPELIRGGWNGGSKPAPASSVSQGQLEAHGPCAAGGKESCDGQASTAALIQPLLIWEEILSSDVYIGVLAWVSIAQLLLWPRACLDVGYTVASQRSARIWEARAHPVSLSAQRAKGPHQRARGLRRGDGVFKKVGMAS